MGTDTCLPRCFHSLKSLLVACTDRVAKLWGTRVRHTRPPVDVPVHGRRVPPRGHSSRPRHALSSADTGSGMRGSDLVPRRQFVESQDRDPQELGDFKSKA
ncbi:hypothetical protein NDU88_008972 [Pleurodeles waltl]|uniref:Uncharacterized protein n=1 Tax=Pleurodeles waltl TaxID=8319 RepID=A0AAV7PR43_PLEWA|nr:hypothetical protein NDU88_008972 [Pleurodeles waltl]